MPRCQRRCLALQRCGLYKRSRCRCHWTASWVPIHCRHCHHPLCQGSQPSVTRDHLVPIGDAALCRNLRFCAGSVTRPNRDRSMGDLFSSQSVARWNRARSQCGGREFDPPAVHQPSLITLRAMSYGWQANLLAKVARRSLGEGGHQPEAERAKVGHRSSVAAKVELSVSAPTYFGHVCCQFTPIVIGAGATSGAMLLTRNRPSDETA